MAMAVRPCRMWRTEFSVGTGRLLRGGRWRAVPNPPRIALAQIAQNLSTRRRLTAAAMTATIQAGWGIIQTKGMSDERNKQWNHRVL